MNQIVGLPEVKAIQPMTNVVNDNFTDFHLRIGMAAAILSRSPRYCQYPIACIRLWLEPAIWLDQIHFFRDPGGLPVGYLTWAYLTEEVEKRLINDPNVLLHISEWNEGGQLWILDFVILDGCPLSHIREAVALFKRDTCAKSLRRREDGTVRKVILWRRTALAGTLLQVK